MRHVRSIIMAGILIVALAVSFAVTGCAQTANFTGVWKVKGMVNNGETVPKESMEALEKNGMTIFTEFKSDGTFVLYVFGSPSNGTYKVEGDKAKIDIDDASLVKDGTATIEGDTLKIQSSDGNTVLEFARSDAAAITASAEAAKSANTPEPETSDEAAQQ